MASHLLSKEQLDQFFQQGFLVVRDFFSKEELQPLVEEINRQVDELANDLHAHGKIKDKFENEGFYTRLTKIEEQFPGTVVLLHKKRLVSPALAAIWSHPRLLDIIQQILGPEIAGHPVWNLRTKTPNNPAVTVPWHQDTAYLFQGAENTLQPTAWIPLIDANLVNGCMKVVKGGNKKGVLPHSCCAANSWYVMIDDKDIQALGCEEVLCEVPMGSFLLIDQLIPHCSLENKSDKIRWSIDVRWQRPNEPHGFFGLKQPILMRTAKDPNYKIDWSIWDQHDRKKISDKGLDDKFSIITTGPWMKRWPITQANHHSAHFKDSSEEDWAKA